jgi:hypothetical protein
MDFAAQEVNVMGHLSRKPNSNEPNDDVYDDLARRLNEGAKKLTALAPE